MILKYLKLTIKCYWIGDFVVIGSTYTHSYNPQAKCIKGR